MRDRRGESETGWRRRDGEGEMEKERIEKER
jgi:hypothetical protein